METPRSATAQEFLDGTPVNLTPQRFSVILVPFEAERLVHLFQLHIVEVTR